MTTEALDSAQLARTAHRYLEPLHTLVYFVPENSERYQALGIKGGMRGYFASRRPCSTSSDVRSTPATPPCRGPNPCIFSCGTLRRCCASIEVTATSPPSSLPVSPDLTRP